MAVKRDAANEDERMLLYVEAQAGMNLIALFVEKKRFLRARPVPYDVPAMIMALWYGAPRKQKWMALAIEISSIEFRASFFYPDRLPKGADFDERLRTALTATLGAKPAKQ
jgi:hypothetical protein